LSTGHATNPLAGASAVKASGNGVFQQKTQEQEPDFRAYLPEPIWSFLRRTRQEGQGVHALLKFFSLTYLVTWICFIAVAAAIPASTPPGAALVYLGAVAPSLVALWLTARAEGGEGVRTLLSGVVKWRVAARWYWFAIGYTAAVKLSVAVIHRAAVGQWPRFG